MWVCGQILLANPTPTVVLGKGFTVSRPSQGIYRITFNQQVGRIISPLGILILPASTTEARFCRGFLTPVDSNNYVDAVITDAAGAVQDPVGADLLSFQILIMLKRLPA
jgi:hypothetical protein